MREQWLKKSLGRADRELGETRLKPLDADLLRKAARRRRSSRWILGGMMVALVVAGGVSITLRWGHPIAPANGRAVRIAPREAGSHPAAPGLLDVGEQIALEAQLRLDHRRLRLTTARRDSVDLAEQRKEAARIMIMAASRRGELAQKQEAEDLYARAIALFPETDSAAIARKALGLPGR